MTHANHLKVMIDEDFIDPRTIECLKKLSSLKVKTIFECGFQMGEKDAVLISSTEDFGVLLTGDKNTIDERKYPPCSHGGIIIVKHKRPSADEICKRMKAFCLSGHRALAKNHVTHLYATHAVIYRCNKKKPITTRFKK